ncbi:hypothetical protein ACTFIU_008633 [Dictyostelium citrinum]
MYNLYKKVFNNLVISKIIWRYVRYEQWGDESMEGGYLDYSVYDKITGSFKTHDITMGMLLKKKMYKLFNDFIDFFFKVALHNPVKYWYCQLRLEEKNIPDDGLPLLLGYKELSFQRFHLIYQYFKPNAKFIKDKEIILNVAALNGNIEIYEFLKKEKDENNQPMFEFTPPSFVKYSFYKVNPYSLIPFGESDKFGIFLEQIKFYEKDIELVGGEKKLQVLLYSLVKKKLFKHFKYLVTNIQFKKVISKFSEEVLVQVACKFSSIEFANLLIEEGFVSKNPIKDFRNFKISPFVDANDISKPFDFQVVKFFWNGLRNDFELKSAISLCNINYPKDLNLFSDSTLYFILSDNSFNPTKQEFQYIINNRNSTILKNSNLLKRVALNITTKLLDVDYLEIFIQYVFNNVKDFKFPIECFKGKFEIIKSLYDNKQMVLNYDQVVNENFSPHGLFGGDVKSFEFYLSIEKLKTIEKNPMPTIDIAIRESYFEIVKLIFNKLNFSNYAFNIYNFQPTLEFINICKFLFHHPKCTIHQNGRLSDTIYIIPKLYHFFLQNKFITNRPPKNYYLFINDLLLFKQFCKIDPKFISNAPDSNLYRIRVELFSTSSYSILEYIVKTMKILPSESLDKRNRKQLILSTWTRIDRLYYFIENDKKLITRHYDQFIEYFFNDYDCAFLNLILNHPSYSQDFKVSFLISTIMYAVLDINSNVYVHKLNLLQFDQSIILDNDLIDKSIGKITNKKKRYIGEKFVKNFEHSFYNIILPSFSNSNVNSPYNSSNNNNNNLIIISRLILIKIKELNQNVNNINNDIIINSNNNNIKNNLIFNFK